MSQASIGKSPKWGSFIERSLNGESESFQKMTLLQSGQVMN
jgi:hypothetical protein